MGASRVASMASYDERLRVRPGLSGVGSMKNRLKYPPVPWAKSIWMNTSRLRPVYSNGADSSNGMSFSPLGNVTVPLNTGVISLVGTHPSSRDCMSVSAIHILMGLSSELGLKLFLSTMCFIVPLANMRSEG